MSLYGERVPAPEVVLRRTLELHLDRILSVTVIDDATGRSDVWVRAHNADGLQVGQLHCKPGALRPISDLFASVAAELGIAP